MNAQRHQDNLNEQRNQAILDAQRNQAILNTERFEQMKLAKLNEEIKQAKLNEERKQQRIQLSYSNFDETVQYRARVKTNASPIPPLPKKKVFDGSVSGSSTSSSSSGSIPKPARNNRAPRNNAAPRDNPAPRNNPAPRDNPAPMDNPAPRNNPVFNKPPPTYHEITMDLNTYLPMLKASIKDVKDPKFLQFHKELNKTKPLSDIRLSLINNQHLSDVQLIVGDKKEVIYGHKMFLITASSLFHTHFECNNEVQLIVENVETPVLLEILKYCYTNQVDITEKNVLELLKAANYLKVRQISNVCHSFISNLFNEDSIFVIFEKALEQKNELFEKKCIAFMLNNEEKCFSSKGFYKIGFSSLLDIVGRCKFNNEKNEEIIKKWNGAENMVFAPTENAFKDTTSKPVKGHPAQSAKQGKAKASTSSSTPQPGPMIPSLFDLNLNAPNTSEFVYRDDDNESVVSKDDDTEMKTRIFLNGSKKRGVSEFRYVHYHHLV